MNLIVIAKAPVAGRVKTRLCPPCTTDEAAVIAEAALYDTLQAVTGVAGARAVLALDGEPGRWMPPGMRVVDQHGDGLDERIAAAFDVAGAPALLIGMDTPHVTTDLLTDGIDTLMTAGVDAVLGHAVDGGWWAAGLRRCVPNAFRGVPMSTSFTGRAQHARFRTLGWNVATLPTLRDVDTFADALVVAADAPHTRFARSVHDVSDRAEAASA